MKKKTTAEFIKEAQLLHNNFYTYNNTVYKNNRTKVVITCPTHGEFQQTPNNHLQNKGRGCRQCQYDKLAAKFSTAQEDFIETASITHKNKYNYSNVVYKNIHTKITIVCPEHGKFTQTPNHHLKGHGCGKCQLYDGGFKTQLPGYLYYISINNGQAYKIGITNRSVEERFLVADLKTITILKVWKYTEGLGALEEETRILRQYKEYKYQGPALLSSGNTELFIIDILGLDNETTTTRKPETT